MNCILELLLTTVPPESGGIEIGEGEDGVKEEGASGVAPRACTKQFNDKFPHSAEFPAWQTTQCGGGVGELCPWNSSATSKSMKFTSRPDIYFV